MRTTDYLELLIAARFAHAVAEGDFDAASAWIGAAAYNAGLVTVPDDDAPNDGAEGGNAG